MSVARQSFPQEDYEVIVVNNDPKDGRVAALIDGLRREAFFDRPEQLQLLHCPIKGLSFARNAGISHARGEVIAFLDDDAIAHPDWLAQIWETFSANPDAGVVGGKIVLKIPQPRPRWAKPGWEKFWSDFTPGYTQPVSVQSWWEFPWGANWSARRRALLEIGGFRGKYGRQGTGFGGGEEVIAAILTQRLGYKIIVDPYAEVFHTPESDRFTFRHVWRTILAGKNNEYNQQRDLYLPVKLGLGNIAKKTARHLKTALLGKDLYLHQRIEYLFNIWAELRLVGRLVQDIFARLQRPYILKGRENL
jgi:glycosyltransferase involved in cell wall biosynthesis